MHLNTNFILSFDFLTGISTRTSNPLKETSINFILCSMNQFIVKLAIHMSAQWTTSPWGNGLGLVLVLSRCLAADM